jgi:small conductance mechanosensitive channel
MHPQSQEPTPDVLADFITYATSNLPEFLLRLLGAVLLLLVGRWLAQRFSAILTRLLERNLVDKTVVTFLSRSVYALTLVVTLLVALSWIGIPTTSIVAILGASTLAVGLALQDSLSNLASGLLLVFLKPFVVDDLVQIGSDANEGTITRIRFFHTELNTSDNKVLLVPNGDVMANKILNYTRRDNRRIDLVVGVSYDEDIRKAKAILSEIVGSDPRILPEPAPRIAVNDLGESSVSLIVRPFVRTSDYDATRADLLERIKLRFDEAGIVPNPQRPLNLVQTPEKKP